MRREIKERNGEEMGHHVEKGQTTKKLKGMERKTNEEGRKRVKRREGTGKESRIQQDESIY